MVKPTTDETVDQDLAKAGAGGFLLVGLAVGCILAGFLVWERKDREAEAACEVSAAVDAASMIGPMPGADWTVDTSACR